MHKLAAVVLSSTVALTAGCSHQAAPAPAPTPQLQTVLARQGTLSPTISLSGIIAPLQNVALSSTLAEPADAVYVREGDYVRAGQPLAQLDTADLQADLAQAGAKVSQTAYQARSSIEQGNSGLRQAQAQLAQAQAQYQFDNTNLQRNVQLYRKGFVSTQTLQQSRTQVTTDEASVRSAQAALQNARVTVEVNGSDDSGLQQANLAAARASATSYQVQISRATIVSPVDGIVVNRNLNPGEYPGSRQIFTIQEVKTVYAILNASSDDVLRIQPGAAATVRMGSVGRSIYPGVVEAVLGQVDPGSTNFIVKVRLANPGGALKSGMVVTAHVNLAPASGIVVPTSAFTDATHQAVRVVASDGSTRIVTVHDLGHDSANSIVDGLSPGTRVIAGSE